MQRSGEENTDGDGGEQDLFQKNDRKISSFAWSVGDCVYFIIKERAKGGLGGVGGVIGPTVDLK